MGELGQYRTGDHERRTVDGPDQCPGSRLGLRFVVVKQPDQDRSVDERSTRHQAASPPARGWPPEPAAEETDRATKRRRAASTRSAAE